MTTLLNKASKRLKKLAIFTLLRLVRAFASWRGAAKELAQYIDGDMQTAVNCVHALSLVTIIVMGCPEPEPSDVGGGDDGDETI